MVIAEKIQTRVVGSGGQNLDAMLALGLQRPEVAILPSTVDEAAIRKEIKVAPEHGFEYIAALSRNRFAAQKAEMQVSEPGVDYALITSDTGLLVERDGKYSAVTDKVRPEDTEAYLDEINRKGMATLIGAVTFGRKEGESMMTVLTFREIPLSRPLTELPRNPQDILEYQDQERDATVGYIEPKAGEKGQIHFVKKINRGIYPMQPQQQDETGQRYMTGLTESVVDLAEKSAIFDKEVAPIMEEEVGSHPFNTLAFYSEFQRSGETDLLAFYKKLLDNSDGHFTQFGGNCTMFVLDMERKLRDIGHNSKVAVFTSDQPSHPQGHGALYTESDGISYFIDPGLTFPYPVPISKEVPLFPSVFRGNKVVLLDVTDVNEDGLPDLIILKGGKKIVLPGKQLMDVDQFKAIMPQVLVDLHEIRNKLKVDFHTRHGEKRGSVLLDRQSGEVGLVAGDMSISLPLQELVTNAQEQEEIGQAFAQNGIDFGQVLPQLQAYSAIA